MTPLLFAPSVHPLFSEYLVKSVYSREIILDISSTVVDELKEIVLFQFDSLSNDTLRMTSFSVETSRLDGESFIPCNSDCDGGGLAEPWPMR